VPNAGAGLHTSNSNDNNGDVIQVSFVDSETVVKKCKHPELNGTFKRRDGSEVFEKSGLWKGKSVTFMISHSRDGRSWYIDIDYGTKRTLINWQWTASEMPSETGWVRYLA
jgi:hypothetical protein